jgi:hypothetical protein
MCTKMRRIPSSFSLVLAAIACWLLPPAFAEPGADLIKPPRAKGWADLAKLPDWSGVKSEHHGPERAGHEQRPALKTRDVDPDRRFGRRGQAGRPKGLFKDCLPRRCRVGC